MQLRATLALLVVVVLALGSSEVDAIKLKRTRAGHLNRRSPIIVAKRHISYGGAFPNDPLYSEPLKPK